MKLTISDSVKPVAKTVVVPKSVAHRVEMTDLVKNVADLNFAYQQLTDHERSLDGVCECLNNIQNALNVLATPGVHSEALEIFNLHGELEGLFDKPVATLTRLEATAGFEGLFGDAWKGFVNLIKKICRAIASLFDKLAGDVKVSKEAADAAVAAVKKRAVEEISDANKQHAEALAKEVEAKKNAESDMKVWEELANKAWMELTTSNQRLEQLEKTFNERVAAKADEISKGWQETAFSTASELQKSQDKIKSLEADKKNSVPLEEFNAFLDKFVEDTSMNTHKFLEIAHRIENANEQGGAEGIRKTLKQLGWTDANVEMHAQLLKEFCDKKLPVSKEVVKKSEVVTERILDTIEKKFQNANGGVIAAMKSKLSSAVHGITALRAKAARALTQYKNRATKQMLVISDTAKFNDPDADATEAIHIASESLEHLESSLETLNTLACNLYTLEKSQTFLSKESLPDTAVEMLAISPRVTQAVGSLEGMTRIEALEGIGESAKKALESFKKVASDVIAKLIEFFKKIFTTTAMKAKALQEAKKINLDKKVTTFDKMNLAAMQKLGDEVQKYVKLDEFLKVIGPNTDYPDYPAGDVYLKITEIMQKLANDYASVAVLDHGKINLKSSDDLNREGTLKELGYTMGDCQQAGRWFIEDAKKWEVLNTLHAKIRAIRLGATDAKIGAALIEADRNHSLVKNTVAAEKLALQAALKFATFGSKIRGALSGNLTKLYSAIDGAKSEAEPKAGVTNTKPVEG